MRRSAWLPMAPGSDPGVSPPSIRVAVIGAGDFGRNHARVYRQLEGVELIGVVDADPDRARRVAEEFSTCRLARTRCASRQSGCR